MSFWVTFKTAKLKPGHHPKEPDAYERQNFVTLVETMPREGDFVFLGNDRWRVLCAPAFRFEKNEEGYHQPLSGRGQGVEILLTQRLQGDPR